MSIGHIPIDVAAGTAFTLLASLSTASRGEPGALPDDLLDALAAIGDTEGETWLNLLGVPLDAGPPYSAERLADALDTIDAVELRRHVLGRFAWSWCTLAGIDVIERAASGDAGAAAALLAHPRYYGGHARASLTVLLALDPEETRRCLARAVAIGSEVFVQSTDHELAAAAACAEAALADRAPLAAIEYVARGYRYVPEVEAERVVLIPHLEPNLALVLAQHRSARLVLYPATGDQAAEERLSAVGRALADPKRVEILALVGRGVGRSGDLVDGTGLSRSTVHHHLAQLRDAGLVALEGNARAYTYVPRPEVASEIAELVASLVGTTQEEK